MVGFEGRRVDPKQAEKERKRNTKVELRWQKIKIANLSRASFT